MSEPLKGSLTILGDVDAAACEGEFCALPEANSASE